MTNRNTGFVKVIVKVLLNHSIVQFFRSSNNQNFGFNETNNKIRGGYLFKNRT